MHEYKDHWTAEYMYQIRHICNRIDDLQVAIEELYRVDRHVRRVIDAISGEA
ncbi:hypothetical protein [Cutibacterium granulosum]|uniref:hypothetical protein n=1 Tax=Cutibacterium granulosum TaxID=33011 RepID=UPI002B228F42|nr:hypothetical protein [Cutibacterium granulosum]MEA5638380.1 hypothetical protein [Cutibacterium granulosum]